MPTLTLPSCVMIVSKISKKTEVQVGYLYNEDSSTDTDSLNFFLY